MFYCTYDAAARMALSMRPVVLRLQVCFLLSLLSGMLVSCMVGPDFRSPHGPQEDTYTEDPKPLNTIHIKNLGQAGRTQHFLYCKDIPGLWWYLFQSPELNELIEQGLAHNSTVAAAKAALLQAQENWYAQVGSTLLPNFSGAFMGERLLPNNANLGAPGGLVNNPFNLFNASINVSYTLDVFGGLRRQIEALGAQVNFQQFQLEAAYLTLTANIVTTAIAIASLRDQIKATHQIIYIQKENLRILEKQYALGGISLTNVLTQRSQVAQIEATLPPLQQNLVQNYHALSVLIGTLPSENHLPRFDLDKLHLPTELPVSIPSLLIRQRPDIRASEALLHAASAQIGVATANLFPQITLNGSYGWEATVLSQLFKASNVFWNWGGTITAPLFNGGALFAQRRAAMDAFEQAAAQYRQTVLQGFQNVADTLRALQHDAATLKAQREAENAAKGSLDLTMQQFKLGGVNYLALLIAQQLYHQSYILRIRAQAARYSDTAALFQALGGGWWNRLPIEEHPNLTRNMCQYTMENVLRKDPRPTPCVKLSPLPVLEVE